MKFFTQIFVACLLMVGVGLSSAFSQMDIGTLKKGVVKITAKFSNDREIGTGFIAAKGKKYLFIVTASHVVEGKDVIQVTFFTHQEETFPAKIVKMEGGDSKGLALLKVGGDVPDDVQVLSWDVTTQVVGGEEVHLIGFPQVGGNDWAVTKATLSGLDGSILKFSGGVAEGNSGGPLLYQGKVIGVVMEQGQFGNAKPSHFAKFTVEHWPGYPRHTVKNDQSPEPDSNSTGQEGQSLVVTGVWKNPEEPAISYVLNQQGNHVTMTEVTTSVLGTVVTAEGEGQLQGNQLEMMYRTALGTMGQSTISLSENGQQLIGTFQDFSNMIPVAISLIRTGESPPAFSPSGSADFNTIQNFGR